MKPFFRSFCILLLLTFNIFIGFGQQIASKDQTYIFFLHNKFIEEQDLNIAHPEYGRAEYNEILNSFKKDHFVVFSEKRSKNTNVPKYAKKIVKQIKKLINEGVSPNKVTVIGTSKGGHIAQYISTYLANPNVNFVFVGSVGKTDTEQNPQINFCGNILNIYEKSDDYGVSAIKRKETSKLKINHFKEIELNTNLKHGFLFKALDEWLVPSKKWAKGNYDLN
ncbi:alpha/beta hydrolase [Flavobacterium hercynium]|uniref:Alpha/beta hydrolase n=1 Tax=Flavobacterium hercynium TaxID=387094 RepID=A0A226GZY8_9FLAO|nr:alpha/beta hydrolase [Flavobacterium hercynium]OXA87617.1 alpha/beta hydrolase [Flavobacterium hercynium]SMP11212.1 BAAT / Acyl-CoA thioester hydrolase C terminal [Flavobacterium hercynium]